MSPCDRFGQEELDLLEQGLPLDEHFDTCADCVEARRVYHRLIQEVAAAGSELEPSPAWRVRVWDEIELRKQSTSERFFDRVLESIRTLAQSPIRFAVPATAAIMLALVSIVWLTGLGGEVSLDSTIVAQGAVVRGEEAHPGDLLQLSATTAGSSYAELRVYFNATAIILRCSTEAPCRRDGDTIVAEIELESLGSYQAVLFLSEQLLPAPVGNLDQDAGAALDSGARIELGERIAVR